MKTFRIKIWRLIWILLLASSFYSCSISNLNSSAYVPVNKQKGDFYLSANLSNLQIGYAPIDHWSFFVSKHNWTYNNYLWKSGDFGTGRTTKINGQNRELGASYFTEFNDNLLFETTFGYGKGNRFRNTSESNYGFNHKNYIEADLKNFFIQPTFTFYQQEHTNNPNSRWGIFDSENKGHELSLFCKTSYNHLYNISDTLYSDSPDGLLYASSRTTDFDKINTLSFEPGIQFSLISSVVILSAQLSYETVLYNKQQPNHQVYESIMKADVLRNKPKLLVTLSLKLYRKKNNTKNLIDKSG